MVDQLKEMERELKGGKGSKASSEEVAAMKPYDRKVYDYNESYRCFEEAVTMLGQEKDAKQTIMLKQKCRKHNKDCIDRLKELKQIDENDFQLIKQNETKATKEDLEKIQNQMMKTGLFERQTFLLVTKMDENMKINVGNADSKYEKMKETQAKDQEKMSKKAQEIEKKNEDRQGRREERKKKRTQKNQRVDDEGEDIQLSVMSNEEQETRALIDLERDKQEQDLADITAGLVEVHQIAQDMNTLLKKQAYYLRELDNMMDKLNSQVDEDNKRLDKLFQVQDGAIVTWCPRLICLMLLLLIAGAVFYLVFRWVFMVRLKNLVWNSW